MCKFSFIGQKLVSFISVLKYTFPVTCRFVTGLSRKPVLVLSEKVLATLPISHKFHGAQGSMIITMSLTEKFLRGFIHFCLSWSSGRYFLTHRFQNKSDRYWNCLHLRLMYKSFSSKGPGGRSGLAFNSRT